MTLGQKQNGSTVNASIGVDQSTGLFSYTFNDPFNMSINLLNVTGIIAEDGNSPAENSQFLLSSSMNNVVNGNNGNDTYVVAKTSSDLGGNVIHGGNGVDVVQLLGSGATVDLTQGSNGIEAVVGHQGLTGETVDIRLDQLSQSALTNGGAGPGQAFAALVGASGTVNVTTIPSFTLVGVLNAGGMGFSAAGMPLDPADTAALAAQETSIGNVEGSLATMYAGSSPAAMTKVANGLNAYVYSDGTTSYTVWTDGSVTTVDPTGTTSSTAYQPVPSTAASPMFGTIQQFTKADPYAVGLLGTNPSGLTALHLFDGTTLAYAAVELNGATGTVVHGDTGANGGDWFGLGRSAGGNFVYGSKQGDIFDLENATSLVDTLRGGLGFDVVRAKADGSDVDLTSATGATGTNSIGIDAVVGGPVTATTVEVNVNTLKVSTSSSGVKTSVFEALLGSSADTLTISGAGRFVDLGSFAPGDQLPANASPLVGAAVLDALYGGGSSHTAENSLVGTLYEEVNGHGAAIKYVTIYTDATLDSKLVSPPAAHLAQAMAQLTGSSSLAASASALSTRPVSSPLAVAHA